MAINPVVAKALTQAAVKIATDKEARSKLLYIICVLRPCQSRGLYTNAKRYSQDGE